MEPNTINCDGRIIANHTYKDEEWNVKLNEGLTEEKKEKYKEIIKKMAQGNQIDVNFEDEK